MKIGIIGFGQLGQFMAKLLSKQFEVFVSDVVDRQKEAEETGAKFVSSSEAASKDIVIVSVPISKFEQVMNGIKNSLKKGALLIDVCSVKAKPAKIMKELAPSDVEVIAAHPLFGPQSGANGIEGLKIVLCPVRTSRLEQVKKALEKEKLKVIVTSPEEHDRQMAKTAILSHFIGKALVEMDISEPEITEPSFGKLMELKEMLEEDSFELFRDIQQNNGFAQETRDELFATLEKIRKSVENKQCGGEKK